MSLKEEIKPTVKETKATPTKKVTSKTSSMTTAKASAKKPVAKSTPKPAAKKTAKKATPKSTTKATPKAVTAKPNDAETPKVEAGLVASNEATETKVSTTAETKADAKTEVIAEPMVTTEVKTTPVKKASTKKPATKKPVASLKSNVASTRLQSTTGQKLTAKEMDDKLDEKLAKVHAGKPVPETDAPTVANPAPWTEAQGESSGLPPLNTLKKIAQDLNFEIKVDRCGNLFLTLSRTDRTLPCYMMGSHGDSVPQGGHYDGLADVVAALTTLWWMRQISFQPQRDVTMVVFRMEESSWFGKAYVGSLSMAGQLTAKDLALKHRTKDQTLAEAVKDAGFNLDDMIRRIFRLTFLRS